MKKLLFLLISLLSVSTLHAGLEWDTQKVELSPLPTESFAEAKFGFINSGDAPVTIDAIQPTCGCMSGTLTKKLYAPGERGEIAARLTIGNRCGLHIKGVRVVIKGETRTDTAHPRREHPGAPAARSRLGYVEEWASRN